MHPASLLRWFGPLLALGLLALTTARARLPDEDTLLEQLARQPHDVSLVTYAVNPDGTPDTQRPGVLVNPDQPMPLASVRKIIILAAYARAVERGQLDPGEAVPIEQWERHHLSGTDGGAHDAARRRLLPDGPATSLTLDQLAGTMMRESDNAAADELLRRLGHGAITRTLQDAGLEDHDPLMPILGEFLLYAAPGTPAANREEFRALAWQQAEGALQAGAPVATPAFPAERELTGRVHAFSVRGTAREYAALLARVSTGTFLSPQVSRLMRRHLEWPMQAHPENARSFDSLGAKGGSLPGVLTSALYFRLAGHDQPPRVAVLFMRRVPSNEYTGRAAQAEAFLLRTATRSDFADRVRERLNGQRIR